MTYLLLRLLKDDLKEYTYAARLAGLVYGVASGMNAILVSKLFGSGKCGRRWRVHPGALAFYCAQFDCVFIHMKDLDVSVCKQLNVIKQKGSFTESSENDIGYCLGLLMKELTHYYLR